MEVKYAGPKVVLGKNGIEFDNSKDDKYIYINVAIQIYNAFLHVYDDKIYTYDTHCKRLNDDEIMDFIKNNFPNYKQEIKKAEDRAEWYFEHEMKNVEIHKDMLSSAEYETWVKNVKLLKNYVLQRHFNKNIYYLLIDKISECIKQSSTQQMYFPMYQNFVHIAHSIQCALNEDPNPKTSKMDIYEKDGKMIVGLDID